MLCAIDYFPRRNCLRNTLQSCSLITDSNKRPIIEKKKIVACLRTSYTCSSNFYGARKTRSFLVENIYDLLIFFWKFFLSKRLMLSVSPFQLKNSDWNKSHLKLFLFVREKNFNTTVIAIQPRLLSQYNCFFVRYSRKLSIQKLCKCRQFVISSLFFPSVQNTSITFLMN